jgi:hypothetical protein
MAEVWTLDGLSINDGTTFRIAGEVDLTPPRQRQEWIGAADSEWQALSRQPLHENREIVIPLEVVQQATKDLALDKVGQIADKLRLASRTQDGIALVWTPHGSSGQVTFDVLAGEISGFPLDVMFADFRMPRPTLRLVCKPYWRATEVTTSTASSSTPFVTLEVASVPGDIPALGRLIVTDTATQNRRHVEWGLEGQYYNAATSLLIDSDSMVTSGFAGTLATVSGAYDPNASGNNVVTAGLTTTASAVVGTGNLSHVGAFRVKGRFQHAITTSSVNVEVRFVWRAGDGSWTTNDWVEFPNPDAVWYERDLGTITIPTVISGTQRWEGRIEARQTSGAAGSKSVQVDYLVLVPTIEGYGRARATMSEISGLLVDYDEFTATTATNALNATSSDSGDTWATSGDATDYVFSDDLSGENVRRSTTGDTNGRYAILGSATPTDVQVKTTAQHTLAPITAGQEVRQGVIARWTNSSNYARAEMVRDSSTARHLRIVQVVAGAATTLASVSTTSLAITTNTWLTIDLTVYVSGRAIARILDAAGTSVLLTVETQSSALATGGTLASGSSGLYDFCNAATGSVRYYDSVATFTPSAEPIALYSGRNMQFRHDETIRQDSTGVYTGRPPSYRGSRFLVPVGTSRVLVKARRNDVEVSTDANVTDATQIQVAYTPRGLAVPRF